MWRVVLILAIAVQTAAADEPPRPTCDAVALEQTGDDAVHKGEEVRALDFYERAVRCEPNNQRFLKAGLAACSIYRRTRAQSAANKARFYYDKLPKSDQAKLAQACTLPCRLE